MTRLFDLHEIINFFVKRKQRNYEYYKTIREKSQDCEIKETLKKLMQEEKEHELFCAEKLRDIDVQRYLDLQENDEYHGYVEDLIGTHITIDPISHDELDSHKKVIKHAMDTTRDCMELCVKLKNFAPNKFHINIDDIISHEAVRYSKLSRMYEKA